MKLDKEPMAGGCCTVATVAIRGTASDLVCAIVSATSSASVGASAATGAIFCSTHIATATATFSASA